MSACCRRLCSHASSISSMRCCVSSSRMRGATSVQRDYRSAVLAASRESADSGSTPRRPHPDTWTLGRRRTSMKFIACNFRPHMLLQHAPRSIRSWPAAAATPVVIAVRHLRANFVDVLLQRVFRWAACSWHRPSAPSTAGDRSGAARPARGPPRSPGQAASAA